MIESSIFIAFFSAIASLIAGTFGAVKYRRQKELKGLIARVISYGSTSDSVSRSIGISESMEEYAQNIKDHEQWIKDHEQWIKEYESIADKELIVKISDIQSIKNERELIDKLSDLHIGMQWIIRSCESIKPSAPFMKLLSSLSISDNNLHRAILEYKREMKNNPIEEHEKSNDK